MKNKQKLALVVLLIFFGIAHENSREQDQHSTANTTTYARLADQPLNERIQLYEEGLISSTTGAYKYVPQRGWIPEISYQGNLIARTGRNIGNTIQNVVRETLRGIFRFFDGVIS